LHDIPYGCAWPDNAIARRKAAVEKAGLSWLVAESVPVSEAIKTGGRDSAGHLQNYATTLRRLGAAGVRVVVYNFMAGLDWVRTDLNYRLPDGSECLRFDPIQFAAFECFLVQRTGAAANYEQTLLQAAEKFFRSMTADEVRQFERNILDSFPGCRSGLTIDGLRQLLLSYRGIDADGLRENFRNFLRFVIPVAEEAGVALAVHPDDPPFPILGLPRIVSSESDLSTIVGMVDSPANGICFCSGSLGASDENDLPGIVRRLGSLIQAVHLRNVQREGHGAFHESDHLNGSVDMPAVVSELLWLNSTRNEAASLPFRPDHGHRMLDDLRKPANPNPGYDCLGRMRGLAELRGLEFGLAYAKTVPSRQGPGGEIGDLKQ
jgi:mannonate dehydratase